jgi:hypothetical protein
VPSATIPSVLRRIDQARSRAERSVADAGSLFLVAPRHLLGTELVQLVDEVFADADRVRRERIEDRCLHTSEARALSAALLRFSRALGAQLDGLCEVRSVYRLAHQAVRARVRRHLARGLGAWRAQRVETLTYPFGRYLQGRIA